MSMLRNNIDNKFSSLKKQSNDKTTITFIRDQLSRCRKKLFNLKKETRVSCMFAQTQL